MVSELLKSLEVSDTAEPNEPTGRAEESRTEQADKAEGHEADVADEAQKGPEVEPAAAQQPPDVLFEAKKLGGASTAGALCAGWNPFPVYTYEYFKTTDKTMAEQAARHVACGQYDCKGLQTGQL